MTDVCYAPNHQFGLVFNRAKISMTKSKRWFTADSTKQNKKNLSKAEILYHLNSFLYIFFLYTKTKTVVNVILLPVVVGLFA